MASVAIHTPLGGPRRKATKMISSFGQPGLTATSQASRSIRLVIGATEAGSSPHFFIETWEIFERLLSKPELRDGPIYLIGHSLGGLVIKELIRTAEGDAFMRGEAKQFLERIEKIVFLATPHRGSNLARLADHLSCSANSNPQRRMTLIR
jgi:triacylglycerol esterase/lipase EstA (alpha/beta hydrolase family)